MVPLNERKRNNARSKEGMNEHEMILRIGRGWKMKGWRLKLLDLLNRISHLQFPAFIRAPANATQSRGTKGVSTFATNSYIRSPNTWSWYCTKVHAWCRTFRPPATRDHCHRGKSSHHSHPAQRTRDPSCCSRLILSLPWVQKLLILVSLSMAMALNTRNSPVSTHQWNDSTSSESALSAFQILSRILNTRMLDLNVHIRLFSICLFSTDTVLVLILRTIGSCIMLSFHEKGIALTMMLLLFFPLLSQSREKLWPHPGTLLDEEQFHSTHWCCDSLWRPYCVGTEAHEESRGLEMAQSFGGLEFGFIPFFHRGNVADTSTAPS